MKRFLMVRREDVSGISGTGVVAQGVQFDDGFVAMRWLTRFHTIECAENLVTIEAIHGHGGATMVEWIDK